MSKFCEWQLFSQFPLLRRKDTEVHCYMAVTDIASFIRPWFWCWLISIYGQIFFLEAFERITIWVVVLFIYIPAELNYRYWTSAFHQIKNSPVSFERKKVPSHQNWNTNFSKMILANIHKCHTLKLSLLNYSWYRK